MYRKTNKFSGGGVRLSLTTSKRLLCLLIVTGIFIALCGCGDSDSKAPTDYEIQTAIKEQIEETAIPKGYATLLTDSDDYLTVLVSDGEVAVMVKTFMSYTIPYTAEVWLPIAQQAAEDEGVSLSSFTVYYSQKDGEGNTVIAQWETKDGDTGTLVDQIGLDLRCDDNTIKTGQTIDQLFEYYSEYDSIVNDMIVEGGGTGYER